MSVLTAIIGGELPEWAKAALVLAAGILFAGVSDYVLAQTGYDALGTLVWVAGYGGAVIVIWFIWLRGVELGPNS